MKRLAEMAFAVLLAVAGLWLLIDHKDPLPLNHEAIGLGQLHAVHGFVGVAVLAGAFFTWRSAKRDDAPP